MRVAPARQRRFDREVHVAKQWQVIARLVAVSGEADAELLVERFSQRDEAQFVALEEAVAEDSQRVALLVAEHPSQRLDGVVDRDRRRLIQRHRRQRGGKRRAGSHCLDVLAQPRVVICAEAARVDRAELAGHFVEQCGACPIRDAQPVGDVGQRIGRGEARLNVGHHELIGDELLHVARGGGERHVQLGRETLGNL